MSIAYLASPYSHPDPVIRVERFHAVCRAASKLMMDGIAVFSPIAHTHPIEVAGGLPSGWDFWKKFDEPFLVMCSKIIVLKLDGWEKSVGIAAEIEIMKGMGKPIEYMEYIP